MSKTRDVNLGVQTREASFAPGTINAENRTVDLVWTTGAKVRRYDWFNGERYLEELSLDPTHVRMDRLNGGAPLLDSHNRYDTSSVVGVVEKAWLSGNEGRATVRFSQRPEADQMFRDVQDGILRNVSVGYAVHKFQRIESPTKGEPDTLRAVDWEPMEISMVAVGADAGAGVRSNADTFPCVIIDNRASPEEASMPDEVKPGAKPENELERKPVVEQPKPEKDTDEVVRKALAAERKRASEITAACRALGLEDAIATRMIEQDISLDAARAALIEEAGKRSAAQATVAAGDRIRAGDLDERETRRTAVAEALLARHDATTFKPTERAHEYMGMTLMEHARAILEAEGVRTRGLSRMAIAERALMATSDFPNILLAVANKTLRQAYEAAPQTWKPIVREIDANDFKTMYRVQLGDAPALEKVPESGEFKRGSLPDAKETYSLATYGKVVGVTRQTLINDDLGAFSRLPMLMGRAAADLESDTVWGIITANANMGDGTALFASGHSNLTGTGTVISVTSLGVARNLLRQQKGLSATRFLNLQPRYLIVPTALETVAQQYVTQTNIVYTKGSDYNPFAGALQVISEPRLDANSTTAWYLMTDPGQIDLIEVAYLSGQRGVYMEQRLGFDVDGMELKVREDFAAKAIDWRGMYKNVGA